MQNNIHNVEQMHLLHKDYIQLVLSLMMSCEHVWQGSNKIRYVGCYLCIFV